MTLNKNQILSGKKNPLELVGEDYFTSSVMRKKEQFKINKNTLRFEHHNIIDNPMGNFAVTHTGQCVIQP